MATHNDNDEENKRAIIAASAISLINPILVYGELITGAVPQSALSCANICAPAATVGGSMTFSISIKYLLIVIYF